MSAPWWRRWFFYQGCHQRNHSRGKYVSECFNDSFPSKKVHEQKKAWIQKWQTAVSKPQTLLWRMLTGYTGWDQENTCCWDAESSPQWRPRSTRPRWANTDVKKCWAILFPKSWNDVLQSQGLGVKGPSPALCCHGRPVAEGGFPNRLKVNTTLGYSRVKGNNRRRRLRKRSGGGHLREDDMASSFGATKNNGV